jgi:hypothetical protein
VGVYRFVDDVDREQESTPNVYDRQFFLDIVPLMNAHESRRSRAYMRAISKINLCASVCAALATYLVVEMALFKHVDFFHDTGAGKAAVYTRIAAAIIFAQWFYVTWRVARVRVLVREE